MNIYLDVNGVLLQQDLTPTVGVTDFLKRALNQGDVYWLTSHCKGDAGNVLAYLERMLPKEAYELVQQIKATNWDVLKTDGIDFTKDFLWFDDNLFESEKRVLVSHSCEDKFVFVNLKKDPAQLTKFFYKHDKIS
jgi:hypothetical protein